MDHLEAGKAVEWELLEDLDSLSMC